MKAKVTIRKNDKGGYDFINDRTLFARIDASCGWYYLASQFGNDSDPSLLIIMSGAKRLIKHEFEKLGFEDVEFVEEFNIYNEAEEGYYVHKAQTCRH